MTTRPPPPRGKRGSPAVQRRTSLAMNVALEVVAELRARERETARRIVAELTRR